MIELLAIINHTSNDIAQKYKRAAMLHFSKFGLNFKSDTIKCKWFEIILFSEDIAEIAAAKASIDEDFLISNGTWFSWNVSTGTSTGRQIILGSLLRDDEEIKNIEGNFNFIIYKLMNIFN